MAKKKAKQKRFHFDHGLSTETLHGIAVVLFFLIGIVLLLAAFGLGGVVGAFLYTHLNALLGIGYYLLPLLSFVLGVAFIKEFHEDIFGTMKVLGSVFFLISGLGFIELLFDSYGGILGGWVASPLVALFDVYATGFILLGLFVISFMVILNARPSLSGLFFWRRWQSEEDDTYFEEEEPLLEEEEYFEEGEDVYEEEEVLEEPAEEEEDIEEEAAPKKKRGLFGKKDKDVEADAADAVSAFGSLVGTYTGKVYNPPPISLLAKDKGKPRAGDVKANANIIKRTFENFGISVQIEEVEVGPSVTRFALKPAEGVRLSRILSLQNNLELALAAHPLRIEAPIPGKSLVGIEIPNSAKTTVGLASLLQGKDFTGATKPLTIAFGRGVSGEAYYASLAKMPHALIAGATGAGKSVTIHALITSLLYKHGPEQMKFVLVDPKRVEMTLYNGIPHLLTPVITDPKKAVLALKWLITEMERRYNVLEEHRVRDIGSYHKNVLEPGLKKAEKEAKKHGDDPDSPETMPYIVVIIDELADIMSSYPRELEAGIVRLAQMSRAVGIHLVLSTQRPSVNVITGLIKANVPARVALQVASQVDSRTILDQAGAEKLLGAGDMLFLSGEMSKPVRVQSGFISEDEVKKVVKYLKKEYEDEVPDDVELEFSEDSGLGAALSGGGDFDDEDSDPLYEDARQAVIEAGKASTSYLQRKLRVGYSRAARLMDELEERGIIGPADGSKPRDILDDGSDDGYGDDEEYEEHEDEEVYKEEDGGEEYEEEEE